MEYYFIDNDIKFDEFISLLRKKNCEAISFDIKYCLSKEKLCLLQVFDGEVVIIIDPLRVSISKIKNFLEDSSILKIMFDCQNDCKFLYKYYQIKLKPVFDIQIAIELLQIKEKSLLEILKKILGIEIDLDINKFKKYDFSIRPLNAEVLEYVLFDVVHLFSLKQKLVTEIFLHGLIDRFIFKNLQIQNNNFNCD